MSFESLPEGWSVWHEDPDGRGILAYRPDVFDSQSFPAPCLPTIYVARGSPDARPDAPKTGWSVTLFLEPDVEGPSDRYDAREAAVEAATDLARRFSEGRLDYRSLYQVPREGYLDRLDELTGREA